MMSLSHPQGHRWAKTSTQRV